jgi:putative nucleotidyltransferase with HDIG domain
MADWPEVAAVEGAGDMLHALSGRYRLGIASSAIDSNAAQVEAALQRVGMGGVFEAIFTSHEAQGRKPERAYFRTLQSALGIEPEEVALVGDSYASDVLGARQAGWKAVWYNPENRPCPGLAPLHSVEVFRLADLPSALNGLRLPDLETCQAWLQSQGNSAGIMLHVQVVAAISYRMALWLRAAGFTVDPVLAHRGGLLHDVAKLSARHSGIEGMNHGEWGARFLEKRGQPELAEIARRHLLGYLLEEALKPVTWEQKLVHYADKLVEGSRVVPLEERTAALLQRYPQSESLIRDSQPALHELQNEICSALACNPEQLILRLRESIRSE